MHPDLSQQAITTIESLCELGCTQVNQLIIEVRNGAKIDALADFETLEVKLIIDELAQIMSIYDK